MSFDPRSLERLRQLGRTLPQPLPAVDNKPMQSVQRQEARHPVEKESNPERLFKELMLASQDGSVPPHLMERLRQLEAQRAKHQATSMRMPSPDQNIENPGGSNSKTSQVRATSKGHQGPGRTNVRLQQTHSDLYTAFQQLLLEDDETDA